MALAYTLWTCSENRSKKKMARSPCLPSALLLLLLLLALAFVAEMVDAGASATYHPMGGEGSVRREDCPAKCSFRCSATSHRKPCMFYCIKCCSTCLCVPSGTEGHKEECPCYNNWKTKEGKPKCP